MPHLMIKQCINENQSDEKSSSKSNSEESES